MTNPSTARVIYENFAEAGTYTSDGFNEALPVTLLQNRDQGIFAETVDCDPDNTQLVIDLGTNQPIDGAGLTNVNFSLDATWRVQISQNADLSSPVYDTGTDFVPIPGFTVSGTDIDRLPADSPDRLDGVLRETLMAELPLHAMELLPSRVRARYIGFKINDPDNPAGVLRMAYGIAGRGITPTINFSENNRFPILASSAMSEALGLNRHWQEYGLRRTWQGEFNLTSDELQLEWVRMAVKARDSRPVFFWMDPSDKLFLQQCSFLTTLKELPAITLLNVRRGGVTLSAEEFA